MPIRIDYFQGPRYHIALTLLWRKVVDDMTGRTIAAASTVDPKLKGTLKKDERGGNIAGAKAVGTANNHSPVWPASDRPASDRRPRYRSDRSAPARLRDRW